VSEVMQPPVLSEYLQHPIDAVRHGNRTIFIPMETHA